MLNKSHFGCPYSSFKNFFNLISKTILLNTSEQKLAIFVKKNAFWAILAFFCKIKHIFEISIKNYTRKVTEWLKIREKWGIWSVYNTDVFSR